MRDNYVSQIGESEILLKYSKPDIYHKNAFRISGLSVVANNKEIIRQANINEMKVKFGGNETQNESPFPLNPLPSADEIKEALQKLKDPEKRLVDEFFWFWPHNLDEGKNDKALISLSKNDVNTAEKIWINFENQMSISYTSMHNLAVLSHLLALDSEIENGKELNPKEILRREINWKEAFKRWKVLLDYEGFWSRLIERVKQINDARLKTGTVRRMKESLPIALLQINGILAVNYAQKGEDAETKRHLNLIKSSGFDELAVEIALNRTIKPISQRIKVMCKSAQEAGNNDKKNACKPAENIIENTRKLLKIVDLILPEDHPLREGVHDEIAMCALNNIISYQVETGDDKKALELANAVAKIAISQFILERIKTNQEIFKKNIEYNTCFFCGKNPKDDKSSIEVKMHGNINRDYYTNRITWNYNTITVPRCKDCKQQHDRKANLGCWFTLPFFVFLIMVIIGANNDNQFLTILGFLSLIIGPILVWYFNSNKKFTTKSKNSYTNYSQIKELKKQGWDFGEKPPGIN